MSSLFPLIEALSSLFDLVSNFIEVFSEIFGVEENWEELDFSCSLTRALVISLSLSLLFFEIELLLLVLVLGLLLLIFDVVVEEDFD